jgi:hypothetical protein
MTSKNMRRRRQRRRGGLSTNHLNSRDQRNRRNQTSQTPQHRDDLIEDIVEVLPDCPQLIPFTGRMRSNVVSRLSPKKIDFYSRLLDHKKVSFLSVLVKAQDIEEVSDLVDLVRGYLSMNAMAMIIGRKFPYPVKSNLNIRAEKAFLGAIDAMRVYFDEQASDPKEHKSYQLLKRLDGYVESYQGAPTEEMFYTMAKYYHKVEGENVLERCRLKIDFEKMLSCLRDPKLPRVSLSVQSLFQGGQIYRKVLTWPVFSLKLTDEMLPGLSASGDNILTFSFGVVTKFSCMNSWQDMKMDTHHTVLRGTTDCDDARCTSLVREMLPVMSVLSPDFVAKDSHILMEKGFGSPTWNFVVVPNGETKFGKYYVSNYLSYMLSRLTDYLWNLWINVEMGVPIDEDSPMFPVFEVKRLLGLIFMIPVFSI